MSTNSVTKFGNLVKIESRLSVEKLARNFDVFHRTSRAGEF